MQRKFRFTEHRMIPIVYQPLRIFTANKKSPGRICLKYLDCMFEHQEFSFWTDENRENVYIG